MYGSSYGVLYGGSGVDGDGDAPQIPPLKIGVGTSSSWRTNPESWAIPEGEWAFVLGHVQKRKEYLRDGDYLEVSQVGDFETAKIMRVRGFIQGSDIQSGSSWSLLLLIDGQEITRRTVHQENRDRDLIDLAANVAHQSPGNHEVSFRILFNTSEDVMVETEIPSVMIDEVTFE